MADHVSSQSVMADQVLHSSPPSGRRLKVLVLHHLGGNAIAMRKRLQPIVNALPHADQWDFHYVDAPYCMPGIGHVSIVPGKPEATVDFGGPAVKKDASPVMVEKVRKLEQAVRAISLARAVEAEAWSEPRRLPKRRRAGLDAGRLRARQLMEEVGDKEILKIADDIVSKPADSSRQGRWWQIRQNGNDGEWMGEEYVLAYLARVFRTQGPFDACIGFSSGAMVAQFAQALLTGAIPRSAEPAFDCGEQGPFKFSLYFAPFVPFDERYIDYLRKSGERPNRLLIVHGVKDNIVSTTMCKNFATYVSAEAIACHDGGHALPSKGEWPIRLAGWLEAAAETECGMTWGQSQLARL